MPVDGQKLSQTGQVTELDNANFIPAFEPNVANFKIKFVDLIIQIKSLIDAYTKNETDFLLDAKANDSDVVHKTGAETIFDEKSFDSFPLLPATDPTQDFQAVHKKYVDVLYAFLANLFNQLNAAVDNRWIIPTNISGALNPNYPGLVAGATLKVISDGRIGGINGPKVEEGDIVLCLVTNAGGDHASVGNNFTILQGNIDKATETVAGTIKTSTHVSVIAGMAVDEAITPETLQYKIDTQLVKKSAMKTQRFYFGVNGAPAGYIQVPLSTTLAHPNLVGVTIYGMCFMDSQPFDYMVSAPFDSSTGTMDLSSFGEFYEGNKLVLTTYR